MDGVGRERFPEEERAISQNGPEWVGGDGSRQIK